MRLSFRNQEGAPTAGRRDQRHHSAWAQAELARRCELHEAYIGFVERGERNVSLINLRRIARVLRVRLSDLLKGLD
jgi:transcriptional regulator with XRE-family HTH domain